MTKYLWVSDAKGGGSPRATGWRHLVALVTMAVLATLGLTVSGATRASAVADPCATGNAVTCENSKPGNPASEWDIEGAGDDTIQGFATTMSVNPGSTVKFKIKATTTYSVDVYRLGYYGGLGARRQAPTWTVTPPAGQHFACATDSFTQNYDCGAWAVSTQWTVPSAAVSGVYIAKLTTGSDSSQITFVVRDDSSHSDVIFKTSDATWQAYNTYGDADFYTAPTGNTETQARSFKVSYNRPVATRGHVSGRDFLFSNEYPTLRFLERNGVDVSYTTDLDLGMGVGTLTNHKAFLSVGHDEYWTLGERNTVEAARDAGVNMMFLSGNEVYWHTRLEPSIDGTGTPNRTLVCYKDTWEGRHLDPVAEGSPTWRDPMFSAPNGARPENSLTGQMYMANNTDLAVTVSAQEGKSRLWRGTSLATLPAGGSAALAPHTVGYESDEDVDNGSRPAGLMTLSTTTGPAPEYVQNAGGNVTAKGVTTHHLTLYRAASGALVFGAGTVQWGWGLDQSHDGGNPQPADSRMQQATLNMLADMGALPTTLMSSLVMPTASTDTVPPTVSVSSPAASASLANGSLVTVSGSATDTGGVVTTVEVSLDGGSTYHRATGTTSWTYTGAVPGIGASAIKVRASDDSANLSTPVSRAISLTCPCSLFGDGTPATASVADPTAVEVGVAFVPATDGFISAVRFYKGAGNTGTHTGTLWSADGSVLSSGSFTNETASGWQTLSFPNPVPVTGRTTYVASYFAPSGHYAGDRFYFSLVDHQAPPLTALGRQSGVANGVYNLGHGFPTASSLETNYYVDVLFSRDDTTPPTVAVQSPAPNSTSVAPAVTPTATFAGTVAPGSVSMTLADSTGNAVPGSFDFDVATRTVRFTPSAPLARGTRYTAAVTASSSAGVPMPAPARWSFTVSQTDPVPGACPCSIWTDSAAPATASASDTASVELGLLFKADVDGEVSGIRFYKGPTNLGTHTGSVWTAGGSRLATLTFTNESSTGWQTGYFTEPVQLTAGTTYIVSYRAPSGGYAVTPGDLTAAVDRPPLHTVANGGVYSYASVAPGNPSSTNYWVDVVFEATDAAPTVTSTSPGTSSTNVNTGALVSATFAGRILDGSARLGLRDDQAQTVSGTASYDAATSTISWTPAAPLLAGTSYTATVTGAAALSGNVMSPHSWSFTTAGVTTCPCTLFESAASPARADAGDGSALELGVSFTPSVGGYVTGVRFFKSAANGGPHTGTLWSSARERLATGTFSNETASGWQNLTFASPVQVVAGSTYLASYFAPTGHYAATSQFFASSYSNGPLTAPAGNGVFHYGSSSAFPSDSFGSANYWVDLAFVPGTLADTAPPSVTSSSPLGGSTSQPVTTTAGATFSEDVNPQTVVVSLTAANGTRVAGTTVYDPTSRTATFTPTSALTRGTAFTATATAADLAGNAMVSPTTWSFTTAQPDPTPGVCPCSIWTDDTTPVTPSVNDTHAVELGTRFSSDVSGYITGVRFYKGPQNTGTHTVSLWAPDQTRMATATVGGESTTGWQTALFASPQPITAGTAYVVSYLAPAGWYSATPGGLSSAVDSPPLHATADGGRYLYGGGYPAQTASTSYLVDPVFTSGGSTPPAPDTTPPAVSGLAVSTSGSTASITWTTDESSSSSVAYGTTSSLGSTATGSAGTGHSVTLTGLADGTTYYYRVTSADASANSSTSPTPPYAPSSFNTPDITAPSVSLVTVAGSSTTATVTWVTNESSTSVVSYGTSATTLGSTASGVAGTSHSVALSGLTINTRYFFRVTSADPAGNSITVPATSSAAAQYVPTVGPVTTTTVADFATGTGGYVADSSGGEVMSIPSLGAEFTSGAAGGALPSTWTSTPVATGGSTVVANNVATVSGSQLISTAVRSAGVNLTTSGSLSAGQSVGWGSTATGSTGTKAQFTMDATGALSAVIADGRTVNVTTPITGTFTGAVHEYRVDWNTNSTVTFYVDGVQVAINSFQPTVKLRVVATDPVVDAAPLVVDWMRVGPYASSSTYVSGVVDAGAIVGWDVLSRDVATPTGTSVTIQVRSGNTATPGTGWTGWSTVSATTGSIARSARYLQYRVISATSGMRFVSSATKGIQIGFHVL